MPHLDVAPDDKTLAFTYFDTLSSGIYELSLIDSSIVKIARSPEEYYYQPKYSPDGKKILILALRHKGIQNPRILLYDKIHSKLKQISNDSTKVVEAVFNRDGGGIFFIAASSYGNYSPVARPGYHGNDIFYMDTSGANIRKITNYNAYAMNGLALTKDGEEILSDIQKRDKDGNNELDGLYSIPIKSSKSFKQFVVKEPILFRKWDSGINDTIYLNTGYTSYFSPVISKDEKTLLVISGSMLFKISLETKFADLISDGLNTRETNVGRINSPCIFDNDRKVVFTNTASTRNEIYQVFLRPQLVILDLPTMKISRYNLDNRRIIPEEYTIK